MKDKVNLQDSLRQLRFNAMFMQQIDCTKEENVQYRKSRQNGEPVPEDVYEYKDEQGNPLGNFYRIYETDLSPAEKEEYLLLKKSADIRTIRNCILFFTVLALFNLTISILLFFSAFK